MDYKTRLQTNNNDLDGILDVINSLPNASGSSSGIDTSDATATPSDMAEGTTAYVNGEKITGTLPIVPSGDMVGCSYDSYEKMGQYADYDFIAYVNEDTIIKKDSKIYTTVPKEEFGTAITSQVLSGVTFTSEKGIKLTGTHECSSGGTNTSDATITSGAQMLSGVTAYGANGKITGTIPSQAAKTITPTKSSQTAILSGRYASGTITVAAIPDKYIITTDANATAADIAKDKTAYVNGVKVTGTMVIQTYYVSNVEPSDSFGEDGDLCLVRVGE